MLEYLSADIKSKDKFPSILSRQIEARFLRNTRRFENWENINSSLHLARICPQILSVPKRKKFSESVGTDNVRGQTSEHIFAPNGRYCVYYPSNIFRRGFENWGHVMCLDQSRSIDNICCIITRDNGYFIF